MSAFPAAVAHSDFARRALALALLCGAAGAALALLASGQVWSHATASFAQGELPVKAKGGDVTGLPSALALVGLAALVAVFAVRRAARILVAALLTLCGAGTGAAALLGAADSGALEEKAARASGLAHAGIETVHVSAWPYVSAAGGVLLVVAGVFALRYGPAWPSMSGSARYERTGRTPRRPRGTAPEPVDPDRPEDLWKALDRGEDPTGGTASPAPREAAPPKGTSPARADGAEGAGA
ncbi:TIGR02234 family membrane protein [Streptomyces bathyalis]|uniref:TIGR02234 family membrane protein n=1 Tax=Streptomyces bathyalis TaxID=2710756 RepID=A0A7T1TDK4_9ACTN|nr:TIGR02234 family membrane protein [Streptomyces bathyalis]QPP11017.1 TIGR02234 family membrane protein [Streptomyces bathyalis]